MKKIFWLMLITIFALNSCGRKGALENPEGRKVSFENVIDENNEY